jgi:hypothetical protein
MGIIDGDSKKKDKGRRKGNMQRKRRGISDVGGNRIQKGKYAKTSGRGMSERGMDEGSKNGKG